MIQKVLTKGSKQNTIILQNSLALMSKYILKRCATTKGMKCGAIWLGVLLPKALKCRTIKFKSVYRKLILKLTAILTYLQNKEHF